VSPKIRLDEEVRAVLERDPRLLNARNIAVSDDGGTVTLRGTVRSFKQRGAAVEDAEGIDGVDHVVDELEVRWLEDDVRDDELRGAVLQALIWDAEVPAESIEVKVRDGWVTLRGQVRHQFESDAAFEDVASMKGVGGISNEIKVITAGLTAPAGGKRSSLP